MAKVSSGAVPSARQGRISARTGKPLKAPPEVEESVFHAAERSAEFFDHLRAHYREARRTAVEISTDMKVLLDTGEIYDSGSATICNISPSGALLGNVKLGKNHYPLAPFKLELVMNGGDYEGIGIEALPVRFEHKIRGLGVKFHEIFVSA